MFFGRKITQEEMARLCGASYEGYKMWETKGKSSIKALYAIREAIRIACPDLEEFDIMRIEEADFPQWLEVALRDRQRRGISASDQALRDLIKDWEVWKALGGSTALSFALRQKLEIYRDDLDKEDWISVIRMLQEGRAAQDEWQFKDADVMARRMRFKMPKGAILTSEKWERIERMVREEIEKLQGEEKQKRESGK